MDEQVEMHIVENGDVDEPLEPCVLCGSEAEVYRNEGGIWYVGCSNPSCDMHCENRSFYSLTLGLLHWKWDNQEDD